MHVSIKGYVVRCRSVRRIDTLKDDINYYTFLRDDIYRRRDKKYRK